MWIFHSSVEGSRKMYCFLRGNVSNLIISDGNVCYSDFFLSQDCGFYAFILPGENPNLFSSTSSSSLVNTFLDIQGKLIYTRYTRYSRYIKIYTVYARDIQDISIYTWLLTIKLFLPILKHNVVFLFPILA